MEQVVVVLVENAGRNGSSDGDVSTYGEDGIWVMVFLCLECRDSYGIQVDTQW